MKREELEKYIDKKVEITMFDNQIIKGKLQRGNGYFDVPKLYHIKEEQIAFRCSYVKKCIPLFLSEVRDENA